MKIIKNLLLIVFSPIAVLAGVSLGLYIASGWIYLTILEMKIK